MTLSLVLFIFIFAALTFLLNLAFIPVLIRLSHKRQWFDDETDDRKIHEGKISRLGGIGIMSSLVIAASVSAFTSSFWVEGYGESFPRFMSPRGLFIMAGGLVIFITGLLDDFTDMKARYKLVGQITAAGLAVAGGAVIRYQTVPFTDLVLNLAWFGPVLSILWIVGLSNAMNLIDGLDGLSSSIASTASLTYGLVFLSEGYPGMATTAFLLLGAVLGYLFYNFPPAGIFMGDSGSQTLGFLLAVLPLVASSDSGGVLVMPVLILLIPIADVIAAILRRWRKGEHFFVPDREHMHHKLLDMGLDTRHILAIVVALQFFLALGVFFFYYLDGIFKYSPVFLCMLMILLFFLYLHRHRSSEK